MKNTIMKMMSAFLVVLVMAGSTGCYTMHHVVGDGAKGNTVETERQWYILWGLVPLNKVDSKAMAKGSSNYEVKTEMTFIDAIIGAFTSIVTVVPMTIEVKK